MMERKTENVSATVFIRALERDFNNVMREKY
jgi:hypothetical protein